MIVGSGLDVVEIARIEAALARRGERFAARLMHPSEFAALSSGRGAAGQLALRFAAKEAVLKALGTGLADGVSWHDLETHTADDGHGLDVRLHGRAAQLAAERAPGQRIEAHLAVSRSRSHAIAMALLEAR